MTAKEIISNILFPGKAIGKAIGNTVGNAYKNYVNEQNSALASDRAYQESRDQALMDYETEMSNSAYQRSVADMKAAGLNPFMMFANGGAGASTPGVTFGQVGTAQEASKTSLSESRQLLSTMGNVINKSVNSALSVVKAVGMAAASN